MASSPLWLLFWQFRVIRPFRACQPASQLGLCGRGRGHMASALLSRLDKKIETCASEAPLRKCATVFSQSANHYGRQMWHQSDQKSVNFNVIVNACWSTAESWRVWPFCKLPQGITLHWSCCHVIMRKHTQMSKWSFHDWTNIMDFAFHFSWHMMSASFSYKIICFRKWSLVLIQQTTFAIFFIVLALMQGTLHYICVMLND